MKKEGGFTLIEIMLVLAITSLMLTVVFAGSSQLRERARFDASVNKMIQDIAYSRNFAMSNVNTVGSGTDTNAMLVGVGLEIDNSNLDKGHPLEEMEPIYASPDANGNPDPDTYQFKPPGAEDSCNPADSYDSDECWEHYFQNTDLDVSSGTDNTIYIVQINTGHGLLVCHEVSDAGVSVGDACASTGGAKFQFDVSNAAHTLTSTIEIDPVTGFAHRVN